jgi:hypothetical protein
MNSWTTDAQQAIQLCEDWAAKIVDSTACELFLFGSAIYKDGEQFDSVSSDLDIVYLFAEPSYAFSRLSAMQSLYQQKKWLELMMVPSLQRNTCDEPGVSIVPITPLELHANIHKSGARSFFDKNFFYDLKKKRVTLGLPSASSRLMNDENRQALEYVQRVRNEFLSVSANGTGGINEYDGNDPMPKSILRCAAQLAPDPIDGEWYDTRRGLELMHRILDERRTEHPYYRDLFHKISVRRGGRGKKTSLSDQDQLMLAELLFDYGSALTTEEIVTWEITIGGKGFNDDTVRKLFAAISKIAPDAKLIGSRRGSVILTIRSSISTFDFFQELAELKVLPRILRVESAHPQRLYNSHSVLNQYTDTRHAILIRSISAWRPRNELTWPDQEQEFARFLSDLTENTPQLHDAMILRDVGVEQVQLPFKIDFLLSWPNSDGTRDRVGVEIVRLWSTSIFFDKLSQLLQLGGTTVLVILGRDSLLEQLRDDISTRSSKCQHHRGSYSDGGIIDSTRWIVTTG